MNGFIVVCLDCGKEQVIKSGEELVSVFLKEISVYPVQTRAVVECVCGNCSDFDY